jgi:hypothetical protein
LRDREESGRFSHSAVSIVPIPQPGEQSADRRLCEGSNSVNGMLQAGDYSAASNTR